MQTPPPLKLPTTKRLLIDLVKEAGLDISDWANFKGGTANAATNPKYCYEWCFVQGDKIVLNLWEENLKKQRGKDVQKLNPRKWAKEQPNTLRKRRALYLDDALKSSYSLGMPVRVVIQKRNNSSITAEVKYRDLDPVPWAVKLYNFKTGECILERGTVFKRSNVVLNDSDEFYEGFEGILRKRYQFYKTREKHLRNLKIRNALINNNGRLVCEVPNCGFDFEKVYGSIGKEYAEVHHKFPLSKVDPKGRRNNLDDLIIVCSNCHSMIHRGGECRPIKYLIKKRRSIQSGQ